jgi:hypothetical protein
MPIIIRVGRLPEILWAVLVLAGFVLSSSGIFDVINGLSYFSSASSASISHLIGGIFMFILGLLVVAAGYFGVRGKIIFVR